MANFGILLALLAGRLLQQIFFGPLRPMEVEVHFSYVFMTRD